jgi:hypothetical protein
MSTITVTSNSDEGSVEITVAMRRFRGDATPALEIVI